LGGYPLAPGVWESSLLELATAHLADFKPGSKAALVLDAAPLKLDTLCEQTWTKYIAWGASFAEYCYGSNAPATAWTEWLEAVAETIWSGRGFDGRGQQICWTLGFVLRRCDAATYAGLKGRLEQLYERALQWVK